MQAVAYLITTISKTKHLTRWLELRVADGSNQMGLVVAEVAVTVDHLSNGSSIGEGFVRRD